MLVTESGIVSDVSPEQPSNAWVPMLATESGIVTVVSPEQPLNAKPPMLVTEAGIATDVMESHPRSAQYPIALTGQPPSEEGMAMSPEVLVGMAACHSPVPMVASPFSTK